MSTELQEAISLSTPKIDADAGVIRNVKVIGYESANGRSYPAATLAKARGLYEGATVNTDHLRDAKADRKMGERFGQLVNVREGGDGLYADLEYLKTHALAPMIVEMAGRMPHKLGLSHMADGKVRTENGRQIVDEIIRVKCVDLVSDPATVRGLFESLNDTPPQTVGEILSRIKTRASVDPRYADHVELKELLDGGTMISDMPVVQTTGTTDELINAAFRAMAMAAFDDRMLDETATLQKIKDILQARERLMGSVKKPPGEPNLSSDPAQKPEIGEGKNPPEAKPAETELAEAKEKLRLYEARDDARKLLETAGIEAPAALVESLALLPTTEARKALIEALPKAGPGAPAPRSAAPKSGAARTLAESKLPDCDDLDKTAAFLRGH